MNLAKDIICGMTLTKAATVCLLGTVHTPTLLNLIKIKINGMNLTKDILSGVSARHRLYFSNRELIKDFMEA